MSRSNYKKQYVMLQNTILIVLETAFSFLLRHDPVLHLQTQQLIEQNAVIKINSYFPFFDFYLQFTTRGVLFDLVPPQQTPDVSIRTTLSDLINIICFGNLRSLKSMKMEGNREIFHQFQDVLLLCTLPKVIKEIPQWFQQDKKNPEDITVSEQRITPLLQQLEYQRQSIAKLKLELKEQKYAKNKAYQQRKLFKFGCYFFAIAWLITLGLFIFYQW